MPISVIELKIESNSGNKDYTCLYKFRVHGQLFKQENQIQMEDSPILNQNENNVNLDSSRKNLDNHLNN